MDEKIEHLIKLLASDDFDICIEAAREISSLKHMAIDPLINAIRKPETGFGATQALAFMGEPAIAPLIELLRDPSIDLFAADALNKIGNEAVLPLIDALDNQDDTLRFWATGILGWIGDERAIEPLKRAVSDEDLDVRNSALKALSEMGINMKGANSPHL